MRITNTQSRCFPYEKSIVINALYDTIEALGLRLVSANSSRGTLIVSDAPHNKAIRIALEAAAAGTQTQVTIYPQGAGSTPGAWGTVVFDELGATIERARYRGRNAKEDEV